ncbi:cytochrome c551 [Bacillus sp. V5-8f]|uniref:cytochrome c551 n=1 Tax=Bacillus sp. V5-8f TaxID=2053044 RepID=UPI000C77B6D6|nr:cytochrome c [Bacillus sp. V5-8f]PLT32594.1 cytochrome C551 [Bacillus sp. V5-8f]
MKKKLLALLMGTSLILAACGGGEDNADNDSANNETTAGAGDVAKTFENKCSSCHGQNLEGGVGPDLTKVGAEHSKEDIEKIITDGQGNMPGGLLQGEEADQVAAWLAEKK